MIGWNNTANTYHKIYEWLLSVSYPDLKNQKASMMWTCKVENKIALMEWGKWSLCIVWWSHSSITMISNNWINAVTIIYEYYPFFYVKYLALSLKRIAVKWGCIRYNNWNKETQETKAVFGFQINQKFDIKLS